MAASGRTGKGDGHRTRAYFTWAVEHLTVGTASNIECDGSFRNILIKLWKNRHSHTDLFYSMSVERQMQLIINYEMRPECKEHHQFNKLQFYTFRTLLADNTVAETHEGWRGVYVN